MSVTADVDLEQIGREAEAQAQELRVRRQELALDAVSDPKAAKELATVEADLAVAEQSLERAALAGQERARRAQQAALDAAAARRAAGLQRARELQSEREKLAKRIDRAAATLAKELAAYNEAANEQARALNAAGWSSEQATGAWAKPWMIGSAILQACRTAKVPVGLMPIAPPAGARPGGGSDWVGSLADLNPKLVDLAEESA